MGRLPRFPCATQQFDSGKDVVLVRAYLADFPMVSLVGWGLFGVSFLLAGWAALVVSFAALGCVTAGLFLTIRSR